MFVDQHAEADFIERGMLKYLGEAFWIGLERIRNQRDQTLDILCIQAYVYDSLNVLLAGPLELVVEPDATNPVLSKAGYLLQTGPGLTVSKADIIRVDYVIRLKTGELPILQQFFVIRGDSLTLADLYCPDDPVPSGGGNGNGSHCHVVCVPTTLMFDGGGGDMNVAVTPANDLVTPYQSFALWLSITGPATGPGTAVVTALPNPGCNGRIGNVQICNQIVTCIQSSALTGCDCHMTSLTPSSFNVDYLGGTVTTDYVETDTSTIAPIISFAEWLHPQSPVPASPTTGSVDIIVDSNPLCVIRTGQVQICDKFVTVVQGPNPNDCPCAGTLVPDHATYAFSSAGTVVFDYVADLGTELAPIAPVGTDVPDGITNILVPSHGSGPCSFDYDSSGPFAGWLVFDDHTYVGHVFICGTTFSLFLTHS